jgi:hypothetical protein
MAFKFESMGLNYIERENNKLADILAKEGSEMILMKGRPTYRVVFNLEKLLLNVKLK